jgi:hypothetical protein
VNLEAIGAHVVTRRWAISGRWRGLRSDRGPARFTRNTIVNRPQPNHTGQAALGGPVGRFYGALQRQRGPGPSLPVLAIDTIQNALARGCGLAGRRELGSNILLFIINGLHGHELDNDLRNEAVVAMIDKLIEPSRMTYLDSNGRRRMCLGME